MTNYSFIIRKAVIDDAAAIKSIMEDSFHKYMLNTGITHQVDALSETLDDIVKDIKTKEVFIAFMDDIPVGAARVGILNGNTAYISRFGVRSEYHNIGIGKALMNLIDKYLISRKINSVSLHTASKYSELVRFYYGRGFYIASTCDDRGYIRALMVKDY
jgi:ribosomal protein S18 acetylase RimI-like enzyme